MIDFFITTFNRKSITEKTLNSIKNIKGLDRRCDVHINDDSSDEYDTKWLESFGFIGKVTYTHRVGIDKIMTEKLIDFKNSNYEYFYSTDNDMIHDPDSLNIMLDFYEKYHKPVTIYRTKYHMKNKIKELEDCFELKTFPGASIFLHKDHIKDIDDNVIRSYGVEGFDWHWCKILGSSFMCPKISYTDHYPKGGLHNTLDDIAENPSEFLKDFRKNNLEVS